LDKELLHQKCLERFVLIAVLFKHLLIQSFYQAPFQQPGTSSVYPLAEVFYQTQRLLCLFGVISKYF
jgi:hypothetical protein